MVVDCIYGPESLQNCSKSVLSISDLDSRLTDGVVLVAILTDLLEIDTLSG